MPALSSRPDPTDGRRRPGRGLVSVLLIAGSLAAFSAGFAVWLDQQALSPSGWATTSSALIADQRVRKAIGDYAVTELFARTHVARIVHSILPGGLADPLLARLQRLGRNLAADILATGTARAVWTTANRQAHRELLQILSGDRRGDVNLNLEPLFLDLVTALDASAPVRALPGGGQQLFQIGGSGPAAIPVLRADQVDKARETVNGIRGLAVVLCILAVVLFAAAVAVARGRRMGTVAAAGGCLVLVGGLILVVRRLIEPALAAALVPSPASTARPAAEAAWMIGTTALRNLGEGALIGGGVLVVAGLTSRVVSARRR